MVLGVICALELEAACLPADPGIQVQVTGPGAAAAAQGAEDLLASGCDALLSWGLCGGLAPKLPSGSLVLPEAVHDQHGGAWRSCAPWHQNLAQRLPESTCCSGVLLSTAAPALTPAAKAELAAGGAIAVDLESAAIAAVAARHGRSMLTLRAVIDAAADAVPISAMLGMAADGRCHLGPVLWGLARRPHELPALWRLRRRLALALAALRAAASQLRSTTGCPDIAGAATP